MPLVLNYSHRVAGGRIMPSGQVQIEPTHPLASNLIGAYLPGLFYGKNLALFGAPSDCAIGSINGVGTPVISGTQDGPGYKTVDDRDGLNVLAPASFLNWTGFTIYSRGVYTLSTAVAGTFPVGIFAANPNANPFLVVGLQASGGVGNLQCVWNTGGSFTSGSQAAPTPFDVFHSFAGTFLVGGNAILYFDGVQQASDSFGASGPTSSATATFVICSNTQAGVQGLAAITNLVLIWNRALSGAEIAALDAAPYAVFAPLKRIKSALATQTPIIVTPTPGLVTFVGGGFGNIRKKSIVIGY